MENKYKSGNTIRLSGVFTDFGNNPIDPQLIKVKIYTQAYEVVFEASISASNRVSEGNYYYDYTIPMNYRGQKLFYEWYGELSGSPSLNRGSFKVVFI